MFVIGVFALGLSACIEESDDDETGVDVDVSQFKGAEVAPTLAASAAITNGSSVAINSQYTGSITDGATDTFAYSAQTSGLVAILLTSAAEDLDLFVIDGSTKYSSEYLESNEAVVIQAEANQQYSIDVESIDGADDYQLVVVEANRSSLGLSDKEYWVNFDVAGEETCNNTTESDSHVGGFVINFSDGYLADVSGLDKDKFSGVSGTKFLIVISESESTTNYSYSSDFKLDLELSPTEGTVKGGSVSSSSETGFLDMECSATASFDGKILL